MTAPTPTYPNGTTRPDPTARTAEAIDRAIDYIEQSIASQGLRISDQIGAVDKLTDAKFVTYKTMLEAQAEQVAIALVASDKATAKSEYAIEKQFETARREMETAVMELKATNTEITKQVVELRSRLDVGPAGLTTLQREYASSQGVRQGSIDARSLTIVVVGVLIGVVGLAARFLGA